MDNEFQDVCDGDAHAQRLEGCAANVGRYFDLVTLFAYGRSDASSVVSVDVVTAVDKEQRVHHSVHHRRSLRLVDGVLAEDITFDCGDGGASDCENDVDKELSMCTALRPAAVDERAW